MDWTSRLETFPLLRPVLERFYERRFARSGHGSFRGVFSSFEEAGRTAPRIRRACFATTRDDVPEFVRLGVRESFLLLLVSVWSPY
jgi:hypothetical protein